MAWRSQPRGPDGRWVTGGGLTVVAVFGAIALVSGGGAGVATDVVSADSAAVRAKPDKTTKKANSDGAWRKLKLRKVKETAEDALDCAVNSYGQVREFFLGNPCKSLDRTLFTLADPAGNTFVVAVSWVRMRNKDAIRPLKRLIDTDGTGSVKSPAFAALRSQGVVFTGTPFRSNPDRDVLVIAEGATVSGKPDPLLFKEVVNLAAELPG